MNPTSMAFARSDILCGIYIVDFRVVGNFCASHRYQEVIDC